jgi:hypothetical protein
MSNSNNNNEIDLDLVIHPVLINPFSDITRRARKFLLLVTLIGFAITWAGLVPNKITAFDIELSTSDQDAILILNMITLLYFIITFWLYTNTDLVRYWIVKRAVKEYLKSTTGKELLLRQKQLKTYQNNLKTTNQRTYLKLPKVPKEVFEAAAIKEQLEEILKLTKHSDIKVNFDKWIPILSGFICFIFIAIKLSKPDYTDLNIIYVSIGLIFGIFFSIALFKNFKKWKTTVVGKLRFYIYKANLKIINAQLKFCKKDSKRYKKLSEINQNFTKQFTNSIKKSVDDAINQAKQDIMNKTANPQNKKSLK